MLTLNDLDSCDSSFSTRNMAQNKGHTHIKQTYIPMCIKFEVSMTTGSAFLHINKFKKKYVQHIENI